MRPKVVIFKLTRCEEPHLPLIKELHPFGVILLTTLNRKSIFMSIDLCYNCTINKWFLKILIQYQYFYKITMQKIKNKLLYI